MVEECKVVITVDVDSGTIEKVEKVIGGKSQTIRPGNEQLTAPGGFRHCCTVLYYAMNPNCITINLPGGGQFKICR